MQFNFPRKSSPAEIPTPEGVLRRSGMTASSSASVTRSTRIRVGEILNGLRGRCGVSNIDPKQSLKLDDLIRQAAYADGGEPAARAQAVELGRMYLSFDEAGRLEVLRRIADLHSYPSPTLTDAATALNDATDACEEEAAARTLRQALRTPAEALVRRFSTLDDGVELLVILREDLLGMVESHAELSGFERVVHGVLAEWFDVGFLELRQIDWDSPASLLERLAASEAVHSIRDWDDLKHRLHTDRRIYGLFHPRMPLQPVIFVEIALVQGLADNVQVILDESKPAIAAADADTAIFYSITNAQKGLEGIGFGGILIKRVVDELLDKLPNLRVFSTLSPVPTLTLWLGEKGIAERPSNAELKRLAAEYLLCQRGRGGRVQDPVGNFHIGNGARLERINLDADTSERGLSQSHGVMVNYLYRFDELESNHRAYATDRLVAASDQVISLLANT
jgi:malonyl-CoA decarboxylase